VNESNLLAILWADLTTPGSFVGHLSYVLLVLSMMMRTMVPLRVVAIGAGLASIAYGWIWLQDPLVVIWEILFTLTNLVQLAIMLYEQRRRDLTDDEKTVVDAVIPGANMSQIRRFLTLCKLQDAQTDTVLYRQGERPERLMVLTRGTVQIERNGRVIAACGEGDFLGEISFQSDGSATADVIVTNPVRYMAFDNAELKKFLERHADIGAAFQTSLSRNVAAKLDRASHAASSTTP
jgi:CRP-like cAMP-binding protein